MAQSSAMTISTPGRRRRNASEMRSATSLGFPARKTAVGSPTEMPSGGSMPSDSCGSGGGSRGAMIRRGSWRPRRIEASAARQDRLLLGGVLVVGETAGVGQRGEPLELLDAAAAVGLRHPPLRAQPGEGQAALRVGELARGLAAQGLERE